MQIQSSVRVDTTCALRNPDPVQLLRRGMDAGGMGVLCLFRYLLGWILLSHELAMAANVIKASYG